MQFKGISASYSLALVSILLIHCKKIKSDGQHFIWCNLVLLVNHSLQLVMREITQLCINSSNVPWCSFWCLHLFSFTKLISIYAGKQWTFDSMIVNFSVSSQNAVTPPRGWNSYDSFSWIISEEEYLQNANIVSQKLLAHGYQVLLLLWIYIYVSNEKCVHIIFLWNHAVCSCGFPLV